MPEFLGQFADQGVLRRFAAVDLAAGKLPEARHVLAIGPLGQQNPSVTVDQRHRGDEDQPQAPLRESRAVVRVDLDVAVRQIAGPDGRRARPTPTSTPIASSRRFM